MSDRFFYVGAQDPQTREFTGYVRSKFLTRNGTYVMDPIPGGSQKAFFYSNGSGNDKTIGEIANPNNYLVVPANYSEQRTRDFASGIADTWGKNLGDETGGAASLIQALMDMTTAFKQGGSQDLQRHPQWGIPEGSFVPAFISSASNHLGYVTALAGLPVHWSEVGGGVANRYHARSNPDINTSGSYWLSSQNSANISQGYSQGIAATKSPAPFNDYGYGAQPPRTSGQIGDGNGIAPFPASITGVNLDEPAPPAWPPQPPHERRPRALPGVSPLRERGRGPA